MNEDDIVIYLLKLCREVAPGVFTEEHMLQVEARARKERGGERVVIAKRSAHYRRQAAAEALREGLPLDEVKKRAGVSRSALYRILNGADRE